MFDEKGKKEVLPQTEDLPDGSTKSIKRIAEFYALDYEGAEKIVQFYARAMTRLMNIIENSPSQRTSLMAIKLLHTIITAAQPKAPLVAIQNNLDSPGYRTFEEQLAEAHRLLKERKGLAENGEDPE